MIPAHCPRIFRFLDVPDICKGEVRWRTVCMIPAHCPRILFFPRFWPECSKIRCVQKPNAHRVPFCFEITGGGESLIQMKNKIDERLFEYNLFTYITLNYSVKLYNKTHK